MWSKGTQSLLYVRARYKNEGKLMAKITRSQRKRLDQFDAHNAKVRNEVNKTKERARRDKRMANVLRRGSLPYPPYVMSWLSRKLGKPSAMIIQEEVNTLL